MFVYLSHWLLLIICLVFFFFLGVSSMMTLIPRAQTFQSFLTEETEEEKREKERSGSPSSEHKEHYSSSLLHWHALHSNWEGKKKNEKKKGRRGERKKDILQLSVDVYSTVKLYSSINITCRDEYTLERFCTCCTATDASIYDFIFAPFFFFLLPNTFLHITIFCGL